MHIFLFITYGMALTTTSYMPDKIPTWRNSTDVSERALKTLTFSLSKPAISLDVFVGTSNIFSYNRPKKIIGWEEMGV